MSKKYLSLSVITFPITSPIPVNGESEWTSWVLCPESDPERLVDISGCDSGRLIDDGGFDSGRLIDEDGCDSGRLIEDAACVFKRPVDGEVWSDSM